jgi:flagellar rod assembly protein/muramidase FlgJ
MTKQEFINAVVDGARKGYKKYGILPSLTIAQAILESGWGKSHIKNNLFGMKAGASWAGKVAVRETKEFINGQWITVQAKFRAYDSFNESIEDHAKLLGTASRYKKVVQAADYKDACQTVWQAGYATDPEYPGKLINIIEQNKLYLHDTDYIGHWAEAVIEKAKKYNLMTGYPDGSFQPDKSVTRAELASVAVTLYEKWWC